MNNSKINNSVINERIKKIGIESFFNIELVKNEIRKGYLLELSNKTNNSDIYNKIKEIYPNLNYYIENYNTDKTPNRILITKNGLGYIDSFFGINGEKLASYLDFDCKGISTDQTGYTLQYFIINGSEKINFYSAICDKLENFNNALSRFKKFNTLALDFGFLISMEIVHFIKLNTETFNKHINYWKRNEIALKETLEGNGIGYFEGKHDIIDNYYNQLLFMIIKIEHNPLETLYPVSKDFSDMLDDFDKNYVLNNVNDNTMKQYFDDTLNFVKKNYKEYLNVENFEDEYKKTSDNCIKIYKDNIKKISFGKIKRKVSKRKVSKRKVSKRKVSKRKSSKKF